MENPFVKDERSGKVIFLSHCCLNQNAKVRGIAHYPGAILPLVELLLQEGIGIYQMTCPEMTYMGNMRWGMVQDQYNNPMFRRHCQRLAEIVVDQAQNYLQCGYKVLGFVMMDGSPVCGLNRTPKPKNPEEMWGGMTWYIPEQVNAPGQGIYCEILQDELKNRELGSIPFVAIPESEEVGKLDLALFQIRTLINP